MFCSFVDAEERPYSVHEQHRLAFLQTLASTRTHYIVVNSSAHTGHKAIDGALSLPFPQTTRDALFQVACPW
jgi:hypothetical protein